MFPKLIDLGGFYLPTYGVMVAIGFLTALWLTGKLARRDGLDPDKVTNIGVYGALAGLAGAKLLMFVVDFDYYSRNAGEILTFNTLQAGGVFYGGLVCALGAGWWFLKRDNLPVARVLDIYGPGLALGQAFGRIGCFAAGCCWGQVCERPWAVRFTKPEAMQTSGVPLNVDMHPSQLYEAFASAVVFAIVYWRIGKPRRPGEIIGLYLILSAAARFVTEFFRFHQQPNPFGWALSNPQWISVALFAAGLWILRARYTNADVR